MALVIAKAIKEKLAVKHHVSDLEIGECFANRTGKFLEDTREEHRTDPATLWFISETDRGGILKVVFVPRDGSFHIKTAYSPEPEALRIYKTKGG